VNIYRYVPDGRHFRGMEIGYSDRFWPDGIDLGRAAELEFPKGIEGPWWLEGNRYESARGDTTPLADFVATTMNVLVMQTRAADALSIAGKRVSVHVDGEPAYAMELPRIADAIDVASSSAVTAPNGEALFWNRLALRPDRISADVFWLEEAMPFSYIYMTESFLEKANTLGLTGLACVELVSQDGVAQELSYPPVTNVGARNGYRYYLETNFVLARAAMRGYLSDDIHPILDEAFAAGRLPTTY
jgi:hypothetical protein